MDTIVSSYFNASSFYMTNDGKSRRYPIYSPKKDSTCCGNKGYVLFSLPFNHKSTTFYFGNNYGLYDKRFIELSYELVFDLGNKLIWGSEAVSNKRMTLLEAEKYIKQYKHQDLQGWRLPTKKEFRSLRDPSIPGLSNVFNFSSYYQTSDGKSRRYPIYSPKGDSTCCGNEGYIVGVM